MKQVVCTIYLKPKNGELLLGKEATSPPPPFLYSTFIDKTFKVVILFKNLVEIIERNWVKPWV